jgi:hypothetical protein
MIRLDVVLNPNTAMFTFRLSRPREILLLYLRAAFDKSAMFPLGVAWEAAHPKCDPEAPLAVCGAILA